MAEIECPGCNGTGKMQVDADTLAGRLLILRTRRGLSLREIPGISNSYYSQLETGKVENPGIDKLLIIANFFGVTLDWLAGREPV